MVKDIYQAAKERRSYYNINDKKIVPGKRVEEDFDSTKDKIDGFLNFNNNSLIQSAADQLSLKLVNADFCLLLYILRLRSKISLKIILR